MVDLEVRREELAGRLEAVQERIRRASAAAGRDAAEVTLVAVTKAFPASDVRLLVDLGVTDIGENREQEATAKARELAGVAVRWHFVGQLQTRKARAVAQLADVVHSVDRVRLVTALDRAAADAGRRVRVLVQVSLDAPTTGASPASAGDRGGASPAQVAGLAEAIAATEHLQLGGVMAVAPLDVEPAYAFARLAEVAAQIRGEHPGATDISAGMSADLEAAVAAGATHLRVGSALLGTRPPLG